MSQWLKRLSIITLLGFPIAVVGTRFGLFGFKIGILLVAATLLLALLVFIGSSYLSIKHKRNNPTSSKVAGVAMLFSIIPVIGIGSVLLNAKDIPKIHNISTDVIDPPQFFEIRKIRTSDDNPLEYNITELASVQQAAYPNVKTLTVTMSQEEAQRRAVTVAQELGWDIVSEDPNLGIVEASYTSGLWGFTDDMVIRLRNNEVTNEVAIDLRSVSRVGQSDLGANAQRIELFINQF